MSPDPERFPIDDPPLPEEKIHPADALDALARGEGARTDEQDDPVRDGADPLAALVQADLSPADGAEQAELTAELLGMAEASVAKPGRRGKHKHLAGLPFSSGVWRFAIPVMSAMALLMFAISAWAIMVLAGVDLLVVDAADPQARRMAIFMLLTLPVGLFLVFGCYIAWRDMTQASQMKQGPQSRRPT